MISPGDFERFSHIVPMDNINLLNVRALAPVDYSGEIRLFKSYCQRGGDLQIADPYHKDASRFDALIPDLERAARGLLDFVGSQG